jgi:hypothetical protein
MSFRHAQRVSEKGWIFGVCHAEMSFETIAMLRRRSAERLIANQMLRATAK